MDVDFWFKNLLQGGKRLESRIFNRNRNSTQHTRWRCILRKGKRLSGRIQILETSTSKRVQSCFALDMLPCFALEMPVGSFKGVTAWLVLRLTLFSSKTRTALLFFDSPDDKNTCCRGEQVDIPTKNQRGIAGSNWRKPSTHYTGRLKNPLRIILGTKR